MGRRSKTRAAYRIAEAMKGAGPHSQAEVAFNDYQVSRGMGLIWDKSPRLVFRDATSGRQVPLQIDFLRPVDDGTPWGTFDIAFEIDGKNFHTTKEVNGEIVGAGSDGWKDRLKVGQGLRVIHIPAELPMRKKYWPYLDTEIFAFVNSKAKVRYVPE